MGKESDAALWQQPHQGGLDLQNLPREPYEDLVGHYRMSGAALTETGEKQRRLSNVGLAQRVHVRKAVAQLYPE
jgi:hypothetical protein